MNKALAQIEQKTVDKFSPQQAITQYQPELKYEERSAGLEMSWLMFGVYMTGAICLGAILATSAGVGNKFTILVLAFGLIGFIVGVMLANHRFVQMIKRKHEQFPNSSRKV